MTFSLVNIGAVANDPSADTLFAGGAKINTNMLAAYNAVRPAEDLGFVQGTGLGTEAATNLAAWNNLMAGGVVYFGPGAWNMSFPAGPSQVTGEVVIRGAGGKLTQFLCGPRIYFTLRTAGIDVEGIYWDYGSVSSHTSTEKLIEFDNKIQDIDKVRIANCRFRNGFPPLVISTGGTNIYYVNRLEVLWNIVENRSGLARIHQGKFRTVYYIGNHIDCANGLSYTVAGGFTGGIAAGYGGIDHGFIGPPATSPLENEDTGQVYCYWNRVRNIKPTVDPGSPGCYGIHIQAAKAHLGENTVEKVYAFFGTNYSETLFTGNGLTSSWTGKLAHFPTPDSLKFITGSTVVADDNDHGWARGGNDGAVLDSINNYQWGKSRQNIVGLASTAVGGASTGWIDYNTGEWSITFAAAPESGNVFRAEYFEGLVEGNIEALYCKSRYLRMTNNSVFDCANNQGALGVKLGGVHGWEHYPLLGSETFTNWGAVVTGNTVANRAQTGVFAGSIGVWCQSDHVIIANNFFEGLTLTVVRHEANSTKQRGWNITITGNQIYNHCGSGLFVFIRPITNVMISDNIISTWPGPTVANQHWYAKFTTLGTSYGGTEHISTNLMVKGGLVAERGNFQLPYDTQTANFTVGKVVTGGTSGAVGRIYADVDSGTTGLLRLENIFGTFQNNELITDTEGGSALVNGTLIVRPTVACYIDQNGIDGGYCDVVLDGFKSLVPWYAVHKFGAGTGGRFHARNYCSENLIALRLLAAGASDITNMTDAGGYA